MMIISSEILNLFNEMIAEGLLKSQQYNEPYRANVEQRIKETPTAILYCIPEYKYNIEAGITRETANVTIFFVERAKHQEDGITAEEHIDAMAKIAMDFIKRVNKNRIIEFNGDEATLSPIYGNMDANVTGVQLTFNCAARRGNCL